MPALVGWAEEDGPSCAGRGDVPDREQDVKSPEVMRLSRRCPRYCATNRSKGLRDMGDLRGSCLAVVASFGLWACPAGAWAADPPNIDERLCWGDPEGTLVPNLTRPTPSSQPALSYPIAEENNWSEGWIRLLLYVGVDGRVNEVTAYDAVGSTQFRQQTIDKVLTWTYVPAQRNGKPIAVYYGIDVHYRMSPGKNRKSTHTAFREIYDEGRRLLAAKKYPEAVAQLELALAQPINVYEVSLTEAILARANYAQKKWQAALRNIRHATYSGDEKLGQFLNKAMMAPALRLRIVLEARDGNYQDALCSQLALSKLPAKKESPGAVTAEEAERAIAEIQSKLSDPTPLEIGAEIYSDPVSGPEWTHSMLRTKFSFAGVTGKPSGFKMLCTAYRLEGAVVAGKEWSVPPDAGPCTLFVSGEPGATFHLIESN
jgi:hypothetical protein